ncbi:MAG: hypothetical protein HYX49_08745 [Chloroflexi bacterium]|nr:hypothetical protein [Chloroflexota bacterium]
MNKLALHLLYICITITFVSCSTLQENQYATPTAVPLTTAEATITLTPTIPTISTESHLNITATLTPEIVETQVVLPCQEPGYPATIHYANEDKFGDGYIARVAIKEMYGKSNGEIILILVNQWLEHYKAQSKSASAVIMDYKIEKVNLFDPSCDPFFEIVAGVNFSIVPAQIPNDYASFPSRNSLNDGKWWEIGAPFGIFKDGDFYRLRMVFGWGT